ncbi:MULTISPECIES: glycerol-3-phosphate dehydrogenase/oxidase [unclassified Ensifer]|uniref:glycerol-3-phosphate dehydrogenase/oxidase n=1 Tax=unclassified Ensifer TaxID=2633371 RepID=UPI00081342DB|nr:MULTISPECIES: glycerol-3-phosphate dehydrogenase/oxidase [unclassified Ensifer]OCP19382.1 glycerol-3-phosphate dehydrogenase [Ensifer sp. LC54]OCP19527.1 glycerol-3-phosphate dehydrogenase [Ensifer sp. LC384]
MKAIAAREEVDVVILGAGVNGAGLFRDLCAQGLSCLIVDKADYASGTSAAPSRLIHGGLKYLETGELRLVAQSTLERNLLLKNAPHYVKPLPTLIPIFSWAKGTMAALRTLFGAKGAPRSRGALLIKTGLMMYDFYGSRHRVMPRHSMAGKARSLREMPALTPAIVATGTYYDATITHPERLVLELIRDGLADNRRSAAINYARLERRNGGMLEISSILNGARIAVRPRIVVNAAGPWIDAVNGELGEPSRMIGGTKGSHILLRHDALLRELKGRMMYFEADDGRICLVYEYLGRAMIGSTDIKAADPDNVRCEDSEIEYLLESMRSLFPGLKFERDQIVYTYSGIRPLPASDAKDPGLISRDHATPILEPAGDRPFPVLSLVGGKWTTFRGFAEEVADMVLARFGSQRQVSTQDLAIGGGRGFPADAAARQSHIAEVAKQTGLDTETVGLLFNRYGTTARIVAHHIAERNAATPLPDAPDYTTGEIDYIVRMEQVGRLSDVVLRRTTLAITGRLTLRLLTATAALAAEALGWSEADMAREIQDVRDQMQRLHGVAVI